MSDDGAMESLAVGFQKVDQISEEVMAKVTIRQRNQVTLPAEALAALGVGVGDVGEAFLLGNAIVLRFQDRRAARDSLTRVFGAAPGAWGSSEEEIEATLDHERRSWDRSPQ